MIAELIAVIFWEILVVLHKVLMFFWTMPERIMGGR